MHRSPVSAGKTRPIVQTGSYGEYIGKVALTVDHDVTAERSPRYTARAMSPASTTADADLVVDLPARRARSRPSSTRRSPTPTPSASVRRAR